MRSLEQIRNLVAGLLVAAVCGLPAFAGENYYRWVDEQGTEVNSDVPPPAGVDYEVIRVKRSMTEPVTEDETAAAVEDNPSPASPQEESSPLALKKVPVKSPEACAAARRNLEGLNTYARIRVPDGSGGFRFIGEDEKAKLRAEAEATIAANCE